MKSLSGKMVSAVPVVVFCLFGEFVRAETVVINNSDDKTTTAVNSTVNTGIVLGEKNNNVLTGDGIIKTEKRNIAGFNSVKIDGAYDVNVLCGQKPYIEITGDSNIVPYMAAKIEENELRIYCDKSYSVKEKLKIKVAADSVVEKLTVSGASNICVSNIKGGRFTLVSGGAGTIELSGSAKELDANLKGAGTLKAKALQTENTVISLTGAGCAEVNVSGKLHAEMTGACSVCYYGNPVEVTKNIKGIGSLSPGK